MHITTSHTGEYKQNTVKLLSSYLLFCPLDFQDDEPLFQTTGYAFSLGDKASRKNMALYIFAPSSHDNRPQSGAEKLTTDKPGKSGGEWGGEGTRESLRPN